MNPPSDKQCETCKGDPEVCATVPGLRHCEAANRIPALNRQLSEAHYPHSGDSESPSHLQDAVRVRRNTFTVQHDGKPVKVVFASFAACIEREANQLRATASATASPDFAARCRPAVKLYLTKAEMALFGGKYPDHYKPLLEKDAEQARRLLDEIDAIIDGKTLQPAALVSVQHALIEYRRFVSDDCAPWFDNSAFQQEQP